MTLGERNTPSSLRPCSTDKLLAPPSKRSRRGRGECRILVTENLRQVDSCTDRLDGKILLLILYIREIASQDTREVLKKIIYKDGISC